MLALTSYGQEKWTLYPEKNDSIKKANTIDLNDSLLIIQNDSIKPSSFISKKGYLKYNIDPRIDSLNNYLSRYGYYSGYTIQIIVSQETQKIREIRKRFTENFPKENLFDEYTAPNIFLYAGKFKVKNDAVLLKKELDEIFDNIMVVKKPFLLNSESK
jgi:hypothetical protein